MMAKLTIGLGIVLMLMGLGGYFGSGMVSWTALIPAFFGVPMGALGYVALNEKLRKHAMHGAVLLALLGCAGTFGGLIKFVKMLGGQQPERVNAVIVQAVMAVLLLVYIVLCVKSFIDARRNPAPAE